MEVKILVESKFQISFIVSSFNLDSVLCLSVSKCVSWFVRVILRIEF